MRDEWYSDKRDLVKWGGVVHLVQSFKLQTIFKVALYRPDGRIIPPIFVNGDPFDFPPEIFKHSRDIEHISGLAELVGTEIYVLKDLFAYRNHLRTRDDSRKAYFDGVVDRIKLYKERSLLVLIDPDTGIKRENHEWEHVTIPEVDRVFRTLKPGDVVALYQHQRYFNQGWLQESRDEFVEAVGLPAENILTIQAELIAADVALFAAQVPNE